ncbi:MAG TPA: class II aldolase/adducin family protein [Acidimicrobiales bacterium]|jgi:L-fuculose-phosphate aldolase
MAAVGTPDEVLHVTRELVRKGLVEGTAGNVSCRLPDGRICMTPSSMPYDTMTVDQLPIVDLDGNVVEGEHSPTSEKALHLAVYRAYPEIGGVVHCHAAAATQFALVHQPIPAFIEEFVIYVGGEVPVCEFTPAGTDHLGEVCAASLKDVSATLLANHGLVAIGATPTKALHVAALVERSAGIIAGAQRLGEIVPIPDEENTNARGVYDLFRHHM